MSRIFYKSVSVSIHLLFLLLILSCSKNKSVFDNYPENSESTRHILIIGIDGCRPDAITAANTPNLDALMANGTYSLDARNTGITISGPGWSSMLTGVWPGKHGVMDNSYDGANFLRYPHFFKYIEDADPNNRTVSIVNWSPINEYHASKVADITLDAESDGEVKNMAASELIKNDPTAIFLQFDDVDHAGHSTGFSPTNLDYIQAVERVDSQIGEILDALKSRLKYDKEDWIIIVSTDHGGIGTSHGGDSNEERTIFVIVSGDNVLKKELTKTVTEVSVPPAENCFKSSTELKFNRDAVVEITNSPNLNFGSSRDFSIECRIRSEIPADVCILGKKDWASGLLPGYVFSFKPSSKSFKVNVGDGTHRVDVEAGEITDNEWHMVSATFDRDGLLKVYVDGVMKNSASMLSIENMDNALPFTIGADGNINYKYSGYIAEVRVFDGLLAPEDIDGWKCKALDITHPKYTDLLGYWKLTEGTGTIISDSGPKNLSGSLSGGAWKDATTNTVEEVAEYNNTPRTVDVVSTALNHLCIPVQQSWGLDGKSLIYASCED